MRAVVPLTLGESLGAGGMGALRVGVQGALDRAVAVKSVRPDRMSPVALARLMEEAQVLGRLEHPNIVPVYDIARAEDGSPLIVMKRIEGEAWDELIADPERLAPRLAGADPVEWHLRVLIAVCHALEFAHSKKILHLDIKPANVMVGRFGEVYLLDWGVAVSTDPSEPVLTRHVDVHDIVGTPSYLSPEQLTADGSRLGPWTDVALLGATLYEALAGHPPFRGPQVLAVFFQVVNTVPSLPKGTDPGLVDIVERALSKEPGARPESVAELRQALERWLDRRGSVRLAAEAERALQTLEARLADGSDGGADAHAAGSAARFGFSQALAEWPENESALRGQRRTTIGLCRRALRLRDLGTAEALAAELSPPEPTLESELAEGRRVAEAERARLAELEGFRARLDHGIGARTRWFVVLILGAWWTAAPAIGALVDPHGWPGSWRSLTVIPTISTLLTLLLAIWARETLSRTDVNRRTVGLVLFVMIAEVAMTIAASKTTMTPLEFMPINLVLWACGAAVYGLTVDARVWSVSLGYCLAALLALIDVSTVMWTLWLANLWLVIRVAKAWRPSALRGEYTGG